MTENSFISKIRGVLKFWIRVKFRDSRGEGGGGGEFLKKQWWYVGVGIKMLFRYIN